MPKGTIQSRADIAEGLQYLARQCPVLATLIKEVPEVPLRRRPASFASLASIVISQQVSKQSADAIFRRMEEHVVPLTPEKYLSVGELVWTKIGLSRPKQKTLSAVSDAMVSRSLELNSLAALPSEEAIATMTAIKGIGPWTAEVYLLFAIGHPDIMPAGDLALQIASSNAYGITDRMSEKELRARAEPWAPWRGVAARLLWAHYAVQKERSAMP